MTKDEISKKTDELACRIIKISQNSIFLNLRFLTKAVTSLAPVPYGGTLATDGQRLYYSSAYILQRYKQGERQPVHDLLHVILHCVFRHWFIGGGVQAQRWDVACDIAAEALIMDIGMQGFDITAEKRKIILELQMKFRPLTAEKLYSFFKDISDEDIAAYAELFHTDDHKMWYKPEEREYEPEKKQKTLGMPGDSGEAADKDDNGGSQPQQEDEDKTDEKNGGSEGDTDDSSDNSDNDNSDNNKNEGVGNSEQPSSGGNYDDGESDNGGADGDEAAADVLSDMMNMARWKDESRRDALKQLEKMWRDIARQIQMELGHFNKNAGRESQNLVQALEEVNRERYDYTEFLKKFSVMGEAVRLDAESFDQNYYSYGLSLYENVALIEPLEYKEVKRVKDFVIAIDTSGSVSGALVQSFVQKTYNILNSENSFFKRANIYIIQCDTEVREAVKITCFEDFEKYIKNMELKGLGGTDFRPVFDYVRKLIDNKEFSNLKGMIYFTDGCGKFPEKKPSYDTAFVFMRSDYETSGSPEVPPWAVKLILEDSDIMQ